jgi:chitin deacetylase
MSPSKRAALSCFVLAACACAALGLSPTTTSSDWSVPKRYAGHVVNNRVRFFPSKLLALTFDDGPDPINTPVVLKALATYHAHATFFVIGGIAKRHPELLRKIVAGGNCVGNHSFSHPISVSADRARRELDDTAAAIKKAIGRNPTCFRPPYGILKGNLAHVAAGLGYAVVTWTVSSADTRPIDSRFIANNVIHTPNPGDIVLMHDGAGHKATAAAVPMILRELSAAGFRFVTLPELFRAWDQWLRTHAAKAPAKPHLVKGRK